VKATGPGVLVIGAGEMGGRDALHWREAGGGVVHVYDPDLLRAEELAALRAGKQVLCEKPAALSLEEAHAMKEAEFASLHRGALAS
jgi:predicted dehydrogenase